MKEIISKIGRTINSQNGKDKPAKVIHITTTDASTLQEAPLQRAQSSVVVVYFSTRLELIQQIHGIRITLAGYLRETKLRPGS